MPLLPVRSVAVTLTIRASRLFGPFDARGPNGEPCEDSFHERRSSNAASGREGYWTGTFVHASDPEWIAEMLNRRYDALFRLWNEAPAHFKHIAEEGLRR